MAGPCRGFRLDFDLIRRQEGSYLWGRYDRLILQQLAAIVRPGWTVWDCGTYLGYYTMFFARAVGRDGRVVAIEPDPANLDRTRRHCSTNGLDWVMFENAAVGPPKGLTEFFVSDDTNSHLAGGYYAGGPDAKNVWATNEQRLGTILIPCLSPDQLLVEKRLPTPDVIKLDIEGA